MYVCNFYYPLILTHQQDYPPPYHIRAYQVFGRELLLDVPPSKEGDHLSISHVCGSRGCVKRSHLVLELKRVNDQRVHCHFLVHLLMRQRKFEEAIALRKLVMRACPHNPKCFSYVGNRTVANRVILTPVEVSLKF